MYSLLSRSTKSVPKRPSTSSMGRWLKPCCSLHTMMLYHPCSEICLLWIPVLNTKFLFFLYIKITLRNEGLAVQCGETTLFPWYFCILAEINHCVNSAYEKSFVNKYINFILMDLIFLLFPPFIKDCFMSGAFLGLVWPPALSRKVLPTLNLPQ